MVPLLIHLVLTFGMLSILAVGGGTAVLHEMREVLEIQFQISPDRFLEIYSVGQLAPGPNMTMVVIFGLQLAGALGALLVGLAFFLPSSLLCFGIGRFWNYIGETPWRRAVQTALEPISIGLMCSGVFAVGRSALDGPLSIGIAMLAFLAIWFSRVNPVYVILGLGTLASTIRYFQPALL